MLKSVAAHVLMSCAALTSCGDDTATAVDPDPEAVVLSPGEGCGDAFFWATSADDSLAVTVMVDQRKRSTNQPTTASYDLGDAALTVTVLRGDDLSSTFCTDILVGDPIESEVPATAGHVEVELDRQVADFGACGKTHGSVRVTGLTGDGLSFADFIVKSASIGCYAG
jgi:hypothetical protein